jgi:hypothetical protein
MILRDEVYLRSFCQYESFLLTSGYKTDTKLSSRHNGSVKANNPPEEGNKN